MSLPISSDQTVVISALSASVYNSDTDYVLSITPDIFSPSGYSNSKARITNIPYATTASYSLTASYGTTASRAISSSNSLTSSYTYFSNSSSYASNSAIAEMALTVSFVTSSLSSSWASQSLSSSFSITASSVNTASYGINSGVAETASYIVSSSYASTSSYAMSAISASVAVTASYASLTLVTQSQQTSASWASQSLSSSYSVTSSYALQAGYTPTSSYSLSASFALASNTSISSSYAYSANTSSLANLANTASYALTAGTSSYIPNYVYPVADKFIIANPLGSIADGNDQYVVQYNKYTATCRLVKRTNLTGVSNFIYDFSSYPIIYANCSKVRASDGVTDYLTFLGNGRVYLLNLTGSYSGSMTRIDIPINNAYSIIAVDNVTNPTHPDIYAVVSHYASCGIATERLVKVYYTTAYTYTYLSQTLNFTNAGTNALCAGAAFTAYTNIEPVNSSPLYFWYNQHSSKKRIYLMSNGSGVLHIFNLLNYTGGSYYGGGHFIDWTQDSLSNQIAGLTYEKSITINGGDAYWRDTDAECYSLDLNLSTGQEQYMTIVRRGNTDLQGCITRSTWPTSA